MSNRIHNAFKLLLLLSVNFQIVLSQSADFKLSTPMIDSLIRDFVYNNEVFSQQIRLRKILVLVEVEEFKREPSDTVVIEIKNINFLKRMASEEIVSFFLLDDWIACFMSVSSLKTGVFFPPGDAYKAFIKNINPWNYLTWFGNYDEYGYEWIATGDGTG